MSGKLKKNIGLSLLPIAFLFLFEPSYMLIDPLPDLVGYLILCAGISNLADISDRIAASLPGFRRGVLLSALRYVAYYVLTAFFVGAEQSVGCLLFVFLLDFFELLALIPAYKGLFQGLLSLGLTRDGVAVYEVKIKLRRKRNKDGKVVLKKCESRNLTERMLSLTLVFLVLQNVASCLPELTSLVTTDYEFIVLLRLLAMAAVLPLGIVWLCNIFGYFAKIRDDRPFIERLSKLYLDFAAQNPQIYLSRQLCAGLTVLFVGFVFSLRLYSDRLSIIPESLCYLALVIGTLLLRKKSKGAWPVVVLSVCGSLTSLFTRFAANAFYAAYDPSMVRTDPEAYDAFYTMAGLQALSSLLLFATTLSLLLFLCGLYSNHIAYSETGRESREGKRRYWTFATVSLVACAFSAVGSVLQVLAQPFYRISGNVLQSEGWYYYYSTMFSCTLSIIFTILICYFLSYLQSEIKHRHQNAVIHE